MTDIVLIVILLGVFWLLIWVYNNEKAERAYYRNKLMAIQDENEALIQRNRELLSQNQSIPTLQKELKMCKEENKKSVKSVASAPKPVKKQQEIPKVFYMLKPIDNYFSEELKSTDSAGTVYEIKINEDKVSAVFSVHTKGAPPAEIIKRSEMYLKPGCIEQNIASAETKSISTVKPGTVVLKGNKWLITNKAIIRYE